MLALDPVAAAVLPSQSDKDHAVMWDVIMAIGRAGTFTAATLRARLPDRIAKNGFVTSYLTDLAETGILARSNDAVGPANAAYTVKRPQAKPPVVRLRPRPVAFVTSPLTLHIPRTHEGLWSLMRWLTQYRGGFCLSDLARLVDGNIARDEVVSYVRALDRGGFLTPELTTGYDPRYRANLKHIETPRVRADGSLLVGPARTANLWRSMKMSGYFTAVDLAIAASMPELAVTPEQAARYADELLAAGYLTARDRDGHHRLYRLKPAMNTGPAAPEVLSARFVWDPNVCRVVGNATAIHEVRS